METTKNIWNSFLKNFMSAQAVNIQATITSIKKPVVDFTNIRATDINVHFGEG